MYYLTYYSISFGSLLTCFLSILILTLYMHYILTKSHGVFRYYSKIIFLLASIIMIRALIPFNFQFTYSIYGTKIMNAIGEIACFRITENLISLHLFLIIWISGAVIAVIRYILRRNKIRSCLKPYILSPQELKESDFDFLSEALEQKKMRIACIPDNIVPSVFGIWHPVIILPKTGISSKDLQFVLQHEILHYHHYDLHLKVILDLLTAVYWWNPLAYRLRNYFNAAIEFSNDYRVSKRLNEAETLQYAESLLNIAGARIANKQYDLSLVEPSYIKERISVLINEDTISGKKKRISFILNAMFITVLMILSLIVVPEARYAEYAQKVFEEEDTFSITPDNAYFTESFDGYKLYVDGKYMITIVEIPKELNEVPIYEEDIH